LSLIVAATDVIDVVAVVVIFDVVAKPFTFY